MGGRSFKDYLQVGNDINNFTDVMLISYSHPPGPAQLDRMVNQSNVFYMKINIILKEKLQRLKRIQIN